MTNAAPSRVASLLLNAAEAAAACGVSRATWWGWHSAGLCPLPVRIGPRVVRWRESELRAWIESGCPSRERWAVLKGGRP